MMNAEILSSETNLAIVRLPTRATPAVCIHGDTLISLARIANDNAKLWVRNIDNPLFPDELLDRMVYLNNMLAQMVEQYNERCAEGVLGATRPLQADGIGVIHFDGEAPPRQPV
jgi:hypothetical protein